MSLAHRRNIGKVQGRATDRPTAAVDILMMTKRRLGLMVIVTAAGVMTFGAVALADGKGKEGCAERAQARFQEKDTNKDGFLTAAEVGNEKWAKIKVADANNDAKVSLAEMKQAKADGKLGHKGKKKKKDAAA